MMVLVVAMILAALTNDRFGNHTTAWNFTLHDESLHSNRCTIDVIAENDLTLEIFLSKYWRKRPLIVQRTPGTNSKAHEQSRKDRLLRDFAETNVRFTTYQSYAFESNERRGSFADYLSNWQTVSNKTVGNTDFAFGADAYGLGDVYNVPTILKYLRDEMIVADWHYQSAVAQSGAGLQWHWHADVFAETLQGTRRWFVAPPHHSPVFSPRVPSLHWFHGVYMNDTFLHGGDHSPISECTIGRNEAIYVPADFFHATISLGQAVSLTVGLADTYREDIRNGASKYIDRASVHHIQMLDAFGVKDFTRAIALGKELTQERPKSFVPWAWMGVIYTVYAQSVGRNANGETMESLLSSAREASSRCTQLNPLYAPCYTWLSRQLGALSLLRGNNAELKSLAKTAQENAATNSPIPNDDEILDPRWRPRGRIDPAARN